MDTIKARAIRYRTENGLSSEIVIPADAVMSSASGLDPNISPANALMQAHRVATARGWDEARVNALIDQTKEGRFLGVLGEPRINVLKLNLKLDNI
jgi:K+-transporting ATPase ATPase C chain